MSPRTWVAGAAAALALVACGSGPGAPPADGGAPVRDGGVASAVDGGGPDAGMPCTDPCRCAERGPLDDSRAGSGRASATSTPEQREALVRANLWRTAAGLPALNAHASLEQAATAHARYLAMNPQAQCWPNAHEESSACAGFTGVRPGNRAAAAGYAYRTVTEVINWRPAVGDAIDTWIWTVYHRRSFFNGRLVDVGYGRAYGPYRNREEFHNVMSFGEPRTGGGVPPAEPVIFPVPGQTDVPTSFDGAREEPTPEPPPGGWPSGPVVSVHFPAADWSVSAHRLFEASPGTCREISHRFLTRENDPNLAARESDEVFLYADAPLAARTEHVVRIEGTSAGRAFARTWSFTTR